MLSMANSGDDTNDSQFFITDEVPTRWLDFGHTVFGTITAGDDILDAISGVDTDDDDKPESDVVMDSVEVFTDYEDGVLILKAPDGFTGDVDVTVTVERRQRRNGRPDVYGYRPGGYGFDTPIPTPISTQWTRSKRRPVKP